VELSTSVFALARLAFHAEMVPSSEPKTKVAAPPWLRRKLLAEGLNAMPAGEPVFAPAAPGGMVTTRAYF